MEAATLHAPYTGLRPAVGIGCRKIRRIGRSEGKADMSRAASWKIGGLSGRSVKGPGGLLLEGDERKEGCGGGEQPKEEWEERSGVR